MLAWVSSSSTNINHSRTSRTKGHRALDNPELTGECLQNEMIMVLTGRNRLELRWNAGNSIGNT